MARSSRAREFTRERVLVRLTRNGSGDGRSRRVRLCQLCDLSTIRSILRFTIPKRTT